MNVMLDDAQLLRQFVEQRSQAAFGELVARHLPLVYQAALRQLGSSAHLAEDVAQSVFLLLAEKSPTLLHHPSLSGWLHTTTHWKVGHALRAERRRQVRENTALAMNDPQDSADTQQWESIRPVLDQVLQELDDREREAVLLRFFQGCPFGQIAVRLRTTEAAAHKCVERALEKVRGQLKRRGITSTAVVLGGLLSSNGAHAAPANLAASIVSTVAGAGLPPAAATLGSIALMSTKTTIGVAAAAVILAGGVCTYEMQRNSTARATLASAEAKVAALATRLRDRPTRAAPESAPAQPAKSTPATATAAARSSMDERIEEGRAFLKSHPEVEAALIANFRATLRVRYADLIADMGLSEPEAERFIAVMMQGYTRIVGQHMFRLRSHELAPGEYTKMLKEVLGEERYAQFRAHDQKSTARGLADELVRSLYFTSEPLSPLQVERFKALAQQSIDDPGLGTRYTSVWPNMPLPVFDRIVEQVSNTLTPSQVAALANLRHQIVFNRAQSQALTDYHKK